MKLSRLSLLLALAIPALATAQTVTVTAPNTVNPSGQPKAVGTTFIVNADGSIATIGGTTGTVTTPSDRVTTVQGTAGNNMPDTGNPIKTGCVYSAAGGLAPITAGNRVDCQSDDRGNIRTRIVGTGVTPDSSRSSIMLTGSSTSNGTGSTALGYLGVGLFAWTGTTFAPLPGDTTGLNVNTSPTSGAASAITPALGSLVSSITAKAAPGNLYSTSITTGAAAGYLYVFNAVAAPADGAVVAGTASGQYQICSAVAATTTFSTTFEIPERYSVGITPVFSSTACGTLTKAATAVLLKARVQ